MLSCVIVGAHAHQCSQHAFDCLDRQRHHPRHASNERTSHRSVTPRHAPVRQSPLFGCCVLLAATSSADSPFNAFSSILLSPSNCLVDLSWRREERHVGRCTHTGGFSKKTASHLRFLFFLLPSLSFVAAERTAVVISYFRGKLTLIPRFFSLVHVLYTCVENVCGTKE